MRDIGSLKEFNSEPGFSSHNTVRRNDLVSSFNKSWRGESISRKSVSSISTNHTSNLNMFNHSNNIKSSKSTNNRDSKYKDINHSRILDIVYQIINDLYDEEIVPSIHEIRRKLNKNKGFSVCGQTLLKMCSGDERFKIISLQSSSPSSKDVQNEWAILVKNRPFDHFNKEVDSDLLNLVYDYLVFISSYKYHKLTNNTEKSPGNPKIQNVDGQPTSLNHHGVKLIPGNEIFNIGGRYLFAEHLKKNGPSELRNLPLGTIINIIQKLNEIGVLVYNGNCLVPISNSKSAANKYVLNLTKSFNKGYLDEVKRKFISLFESGAKIPLSSFPIVYKRAFGEELNYIEIGYERLSDFIKKEIPSCKLSNQSNQIILSIPQKSDKLKEYSEPQQYDQPNLSYWKDKNNQNPSKSNGNNDNDENGDNEDQDGNDQISQFDLNPSNVTVLYPLKITKI